MGEEEAAENLEREREMETPARNHITDTVSKFEESPVFNFINSLSPLKTVNSLRISQRFNSLSFPSVASVFTSPQINSTKGPELLKKHQVSDPSRITSSFESENKVYNFDEQKENYAVNTYECSKYAIRYGHIPCVEVKKSCLSDEALRSDVTFSQEPSLIRDVSKNEGAENDWERMISNTSDFLIFDSPENTFAAKGMGMGKSLTSELAFENTEELHKANYFDPNGVQHCEIEPTTKLVDKEPFPNLHRGVRRRCLVYEMGGARKKQLEESSSSGPILLSPYNPEAEYINKQLNESNSCIIPGIGLHLNALAKNSNNNGLLHERQFINDFSSNGSHLSVGSGQYYIDQPLGVENEVPGMEDADHASVYKACEDVNPISPKTKGMRKMENDGESEGCKRCNCKKSKCLKLYCECFAAGVYCVEPCSCQECFNKPIHEEIVLATRKQIESRNPLAFAPKVVRSSDSAPETGDDSSRTPASARHKRGCNCKKSGCLKKYCECYQEGVGCSINCRCEGCKNAFGRKDGSMPGPDAQLEEEEVETREKSVVDKSLHEYIIQNSLQQIATNCLSDTPLRLPRTSVCSSSIAIGNFSKQIGNRNFENPSILHSQLEYEKQNEGVEGGEMPEILQGKYSSLGMIKSSSPNRKRVSPPHFEFNRSPNRTISRKLILQSIPSFPSLTPKQ